MDNIRLINLSHSKKFANFLECVKEIPDPRIQKRVTHSLTNIVVIIVFASISGANNNVAFEEYGIFHAEELATIIDLSKGVPSHDTFLRALKFIDQRFLSFWTSLWQDEFIAKYDTKQIAFDGKEDKANNYGFVRAWDVENKMAIETRYIPSETNEIPVAHDVLKSIKLKNIVVTSDAMHAQKNNARLIIEQGGDYVFILKGNQHQFYKDIVLFVDDIFANGVVGLDYDMWTTQEKGHGRIEKRTCIATSSIKWLYQRREWKGIRSIGVIKSTRIVKGKIQSEKRYFITSLKDDAESIMMRIRNHWSIENHCHRNLDTNFDSDRLAIRDVVAAQNMAIIKNLALSIIINYDPQASIRRLRSQAAFRFDSLMEMMAT